MLYKKYHKNFVSQFKKGAKFRYTGFRPEAVEIEPWFENSSRIYISGNKSGCWTVVYPGGQLSDGISIVNDNDIVPEKISKLCYIKNIIKTTLSSLRKVLR